MKRKYLSPACEAIELHAESPLLTPSPGEVQIEKGEGTAEGLESLTQKKSAWSSDNWTE